MRKPTDQDGADRFVVGQDGGKPEIVQPGRLIVSDKSSAVEFLDALELSEVRSGSARIKDWKPGSKPVYIPPTKKA